MKNINPVGIDILQIKQLQARNLQKLLHEEVDIEEINQGQINILYQLWKKDNITISELSKSTNLANTSLTTMLERLERQGYLMRVNNPKNRREIRLILTDKCKEREDKYTQVIEVMQRVNFNGFSEEEEKQMRSYLERMRNNLENYEKERER
ncbi:MAG: MarR family transcriptional regulator [Acetivibrio sp.]